MPILCRERPDFAEQLGALLKAQKKMIVTAESCTGGMISTTLTDKPGSSEFFERGFVTYSNQSKIDCLDVLEHSLKTHGAVSAEVAKEMAFGALKHSKAQIALSVTGIAGPDGGTPDKPVGLVYIGTAVKRGKMESYQIIFENMDRRSIRLHTVRQALKIAIATLRNVPVDQISDGNP